MLMTTDIILASTQVLAQNSS